MALPLSYRGLGDSSRIRTYDRLLRRQLLYPAELLSLEVERDPDNSEGVAQNEVPFGFPLNLYSIGQKRSCVNPSLLNILRVLSINTTMKKSLIALGMILMTASAANAGGIVSKHASSVQLTVDAARSTATRIGSSFSISGSNIDTCLLYTSPSPRDKRQSRMPSSA